MDFTDTDNWMRDKIELQRIFQALDAQLTRMYGADYAYTILGRGRILAASNLRDGKVEYQL